MGTPSAGVGPRRMMRSFGEEAEGKALDRRIIVRLLAFLRPYWRRMVAAFVLMLIASGLSLAAPYLVKLAIDQHIAQATRRA